MSELLIGCGADREKRAWMPDNGIPKEWTDLTTLDFNDAHKPDIVWDLNRFPYPFANGTFDEVHAYEVLEHLGSQGDFRFFFDSFHELWRIITPNGHLILTCPLWNGKWAWSDPGHTRIISLESLSFLDRNSYDEPDTTRTDYRQWWLGNFKTIYAKALNDSSYLAVLRKEPVDG